jgi:hypothetical protein
MIQKKSVMDLNSFEVVGEEKEIKAANWIVCGKRATGKSSYVFKTLNLQLADTMCIFVLTDSEQTRKQWESFPNSRLPILVASPSVSILKWLVLQKNVSIVLDQLTKKHLDCWKLLTSFAIHERLPYLRLTIIVQDLKLIPNSFDVEEQCDTFVFIGPVSKRNKKFISTRNVKEVRYVKSMNILETSEEETNQ